MSHDADPICVMLKKILRKLIHGVSRILSKYRIGTTEIAHQTSPTTNLFLESLFHSIYEKIYPHKIIGIITATHISSTIIADKYIVKEMIV